MPTAAQRHDDGMSLGEVARLIEALRKDNGDRFDKLDERLNTFDATHLRADVYAADRKASDIYTAGMESRIAKLESTLQWVLRTTGAAFVVAVVGAIFAASKWV